MSAVLSDQYVKFRETNSGSVTSSREERVAELMDWAEKQIRPLLLLPQNWDGYGALKPTLVALTMATRQLACLAYVYDAPEPDVCATREGGVALTWNDEDMIFELEVNNFESVCRRKIDNKWLVGESFRADAPSDSYLSACRAFFRKR